MKFSLRFVLFSAVVAAQEAPLARPNWSIHPQASALQSDPSWTCIADLQATGGVLKLASSSGFLSRVNARGLSLRSRHDFSVLATIANTSGAGGWVSVLGQLGTDSSAFWRGLRKVDFGVSGGQLNVILWNGEQSTALLNRSAPLGAVPNVDVRLELAHIGAEIVVYAGTRELMRIPDHGIFSTGEIRFGLLSGQNNEVTVKSLTVAVPNGAESTLWVPKPFARKAPRSGEGLRDLPRARDFLIGASVTNDRFYNESSYNTLGREFNVLVAGNEMKWESLQPEPGRFTFCEADQLVAYAEAQEQKVRGHVLVWGLQLPNWVANGNWTRDRLLEVMRAHIREVVGRYRGRIFAWDVVNEALQDSPPHNLKDNVFSRVIGPDYLDFAFRYAREADPQAKLFYNDYGAERMSSKSQAVFNMVTGMKARGVPIDGVGLQMHYGLTGTMPAAEVEQNMRRLAQAGLETHITEMDITSPLPDTPAKQSEQAEIYRGLLRACRAVAQCTAFLVWGIDDSDSWILSFRPGNFGGLLFDPNGWRKPAYYALQQELGGQRSAAPVIASGGVVNAATFAADPAFSAGSFFSIFGSNFATRLTQWSSEFVDGRAPTTLDGVRVLVDGQPAFLSLVSPGQINAIAPPDLPGSSAAGPRNIVVERNATPSAPATARAAALAPAFFLYSPRNFTYVVALASDGSALLAPADLFGGPVDGRPVRPARPGESVILYGSGFGATTPPTGVGVLPSSGAALAETLDLRLGGESVPIDYAGRSGFAGVYQFNIRIPDLPDGEYDLVASLGGATSASGKKLVIRR